MAPWRQTGQRCARIAKNRFIPLPIFLFLAHLGKVWVAATPLVEKGCISHLRRISAHCYTSLRIKAGVSRLRNQVANCGWDENRSSGTRYMAKASTRKVHRSAASSINFAIGLPAPCPAFVSILIRMGAGPAWACCNAAANLKLWAGKTRSSWSPVVISVGG